MVCAGADAAAYLLNCDLPPMFDLKTLRAMWLADRQLAQHLYDIRGAA
jgi:hypothetical protein